MRAGTPVPSAKDQSRDGNERVLDGDQDGCLGSACARLLHGDDRQDADRPDHEDRGFEKTTRDEADREALVLTPHDGVERDRGPDGGEAVDDVEECAEADLFGAAAADDEVRIVEDRAEQEDGRDRADERDQVEDARDERGLAHEVDGEAVRGLESCIAGHVDVLSWIDDWVGGGSLDDGDGRSVVA